MKYIVIAVLTLTLAGPALAAQGFSSLEEQMTGKEFMDAGLDKLSDEELNALNNWIRRHSLGTLDAPRGVVPGTGAGLGADDRRGFTDSNDETPIKSRIAGLFTGWDGQTIFKLENGMIWAQTDKDKLFTKDLQSPEVTIESGFFGSWHLSVEGYKSRCKVRRIQ